MREGRNVKITLNWVGRVCSAARQNRNSFAIFAGSSITNTGTSVISGNIGLGPGSALSGFPPGVVVAPSAIHLSDGVAVQAKIDIVAARSPAATRRRWCSIC